MINTSILKKGDTIVGFQTAGHAGYDESGKDIICSAVSLLVINTINAIECFTDTKITYESVEGENASITMKVIKHPTNEAQVLLKALELGLSQLSRSNPDYISITFKEV